MRRAIIYSQEGLVGTKKQERKHYGEIRYEQMQSGETDRFIEWEEARKRVLEKREMAGYISEIEEQQYKGRERRVEKAAMGR